MKIHLLAGCLALMSMVSAAAAYDAPEVQLELNDGRVVEGKLDEATSQSLVWVRRDADRIVLATSYRWDEVARLVVDGETVERDEILAEPAFYTEAWPESFLFAEYESPPVRRAYTRQAQPFSQPARKSRATASSFVATLANWDGDVEPDGYEISVTVTDQYGYPMAVRGTLSAKLVGQRSTRRGFRTGDQPTATELERWSERVTPEQFAAGPAVFRLPFRQLRPERDLNTAPEGFLQVEVGVFGDGRLASSAAVPLRAFNPLRDRLQQQTGSRFFRGELSERPSR